MLEFNSPQSFAETAARALAAGPVYASVASGAMLALGITLMLVILLRRSGRYVHKLKRQAKKASKSSRQPTRSESQLATMFDRTSPLLDAPTTVVRWQVEMEELARDLKAEIDTKLRMLQVLTCRADEAAQRLERAAERAQRLGCVERPEDDAPAPIEMIAAQAAAQRDAAPSPPIPPYSDRVYALADAGDNPANIAHQTGLPIGDVEFVLSLRHPPGTSV